MWLNNSYAQNLHSISFAQLLELIHKAGISPADLILCHEPLYRITENRIYLVDENFPRIISTSFKDNRLPSGIFKMDYTLDLTGAEYYISAEQPGSWKIAINVVNKFMVGLELEVVGEV